MKLLALLLTIAIEHFWRVAKYAHRDAWFHAWQSWLDHNVLAPPHRFLCAVVVPSGLIAIGIFCLENKIWGLVGLLLHMMVLLYTLGRNHLPPKIETYLLAWRRADVEEATLCAQEHFNIDSSVINNGIDLHHKMRDAVLYKGLENFFVTVFWFVLLGAFGALVSCLTRLYSMQASGEAKAWVLPVRSWIEWAPARLLGLTFAISGNFMTGFGEWFERIAQWHVSNETFLAACGMSAVGLAEILEDDDGADELSRDYLYKAEQEIRTLASLIRRSQYVWLGVIALAIILGWGFN